MWKGTAAPQRKLKHAKRNIQIIIIKVILLQTKTPVNPMHRPLKTHKKETEKKTLRKSLRFVIRNFE